MKKKDLFAIVILIIFILIMLSITVYYTIIKEHTHSTNTPSSTVGTTINESQIKLPTEGNDTVITTKVDTSIRVINEYSTEYFTKNKNLLIMFGSWCSHCAEEISEIEKILEYYKNDKNINIILIAHEYENTVSDLIKLVEQDVSFGDIEVFVDLKRIIRKTIDPAANTVPISYLVDKNGNIIRTHTEAITLDIAKDMLK